MQDNPEKTEYDGFYQTGPTQPEKSNAGPMSLVLMLVILLGGMMIVMEMMDFSILPEAKVTQPQDSASLEFSLSVNEPEVTARQESDTVSMYTVPQAEGGDTQGISLKEVYADNIDSVVSITSRCLSGTTSGMGVVLTKNGYVVTNAHVVADSLGVTVDDLLADVRICPEETIYQIGKEGDCPPPQVLTAVVLAFFATMEERFGANVHVLDWALHLDETSPHIHARQVFDIENRYGEREPKQEKALEALGIPRPDPAKKPSRTNNRKVTFDRLCRDLLLAICREHGLEVETEAIYGGRASREKNDYIIEAQRDKIAELEKRNAQLTAENTQQARRLAQKAAELDHKLDSLHHVDTLLETVSETAYNQALSVVADMTIRETQKANKAVITAQMEQVYAQDGFMLPHTRRLILQWLENARKAIELSATSVLKRVMTVLRKPEDRAAGVWRIREQARPLIREVLQSYKAQFKETKTRHYDMER